MDPVTIGAVFFGIIASAVRNRKTKKTELAYAGDIILRLTKAGYSMEMLHIVAKKERSTFDSASEQDWRNLLQGDNTGLDDEAMALVKMYKSNNSVRSLVKEVKLGGIQDTNEMSVQNAEIMGDGLARAGVNLVLLTQFVNEYGPPDTWTVETREQFLGMAGNPNVSTETLAKQAYQLGLFDNGIDIGEVFDTGIEVMDETEDLIGDAFGAFGKFLYSNN